MKPNSLPVEYLAPGTVLDDTDPDVQNIIMEAYRNSKVHKPGMFHLVRQVRSIAIGRDYVAITLKSYAIVRRPKGYEVGVK